MYFNTLHDLCQVIFFNTPLKRSRDDAWVDNTLMNVRDVSAQSFGTVGFCKEISNLVERLDVLDTLLKVRSPFSWITLQRAFSLARPNLAGQLGLIRSFGACYFCQHRDRVAAKW